MKEIDGWAAKESKWVDEMEWKQLVEWMNKFICSWMKLMRQWNGINERGPKELTLRGKPTPAPINLSLWRRLMELAAELLLAGQPAVALAAPFNKINFIYFLSLLNQIKLLL